MKTLGSRLREARDRKRYTQIEVAKIIGISNGTLSGYERDYRDPDTPTLKRLAELYEVSIDWLMNGVEKQKPDHLAGLEKYDLLTNANELSEILRELNEERLKELTNYAKYLKERSDDSK